MRDAATDEDLEELGEDWLLSPPQEQAEPLELAGTDSEEQSEPAQIAARADAHEPTTPTSTAIPGRTGAQVSAPPRDQEDAQGEDPTSPARDAADTTRPTESAPQTDPHAEPHPQQPSRRAADSGSRHGGGRGTLRRWRRSRLSSHVLDAFAPAPTAAAQLLDALAPQALTDTSGALAEYRAELAQVAACEPELDRATLSRIIAHNQVTGRLREMDEEPCAHGAMSEVYRGTWLDGSDVAVKVLRPSVWESLNAQWAGVLRHERTVSRYLPQLDASTLLRTLAADAAHHLDLVAEAHHQHALRTLTAKDPERFTLLEVPAVLFASPAVLVTGWATGGGEHLRDPRAAHQLLELAATSATALGSIPGHVTPADVVASPRGRLTLTDLAAPASIPLGLGDALAELRRNGPGQRAHELLGLEHDKAAQRTLGALWSEAADASSPTHALRTLQALPASVRAGAPVQALEALLATAHTLGATSLEVDVVLALACPEGDPDR